MIARPVNAVAPGALLAGGMLTAVGALDPSATADSVRARLVELFDDSTLWKPADRGATLEPAERALYPVPAAEWSMPDPTVLEPLSAVLADAWTAAVAGPHDRRPVVRLTVRDRDALMRLDGLGDTGEVRVSPMQAKPARRCFWRWPMRVGVLPGPRATVWRDRMAASSHAGTLYDVEVVGAGGGDLDILVVDDLLDAGTEQTVLQPFHVACVIVVGVDRPIEQLLDRASGPLDPAVAAGVVDPGVEWFVPFVHELSHDQPVDAALALAAPRAIVAGDPPFVTLTAVGRWAAAVAAEAAGREPPAAPGAPAARGQPEGAEQVASSLAGLATQGDFTRESWAATAINNEARLLVGTPGELVLDRRLAMAAAEPPAPEPEPAAARRLLADITSGGEPCRRSLTPDTDHQLEVQVAVPDVPGEGVAFAEASVPAGAGVARLDVIVTCADLGLHLRRPLDLPTADRSRPSTVATFPFHTGAEGSTLDIEVLVLHKRRPIQAVRVLATVRATPARRDLVQVLAVPLTARAEPEPDATAADISLDGRNGSLTNSVTNVDVPIESGAVRTLLDDIEQRASRVLAGDEVVAWTPGERAPALLIELARLGSQLHRKLADIDQPDARSVSLMVRYDTPIIPVELAYAGPAPARYAKLCRHATRPPRGRPRPCAEASTRVVCPLAFWGMHRTIIRTIERPAKRAEELPPMGPLHLRPVLYAAADLADRDLPADTPEVEYPSRVLQAALQDALGAEVTRVKNWRAWRKQVRTDRPELLVALAHTETVNGESTLLIGRESVLAQPDVTTALVANAGSPRPLVLLLACASGVAGDDFFGALPASFVASGAAAVVATLSKLKGPDGARAAAAVVTALHDGGAAEGTTLGAALAAARRSLVAAGLLVGLVLVSHGEIDIELTRG